MTRGTVTFLIPPSMNMTEVEGWLAANISVTIIEIVTMNNYIIIFYEAS